MLCCGRRRSFPGVLLECLAGLIGPLVHWVYAAAVFDRLSAAAADSRFGRLWGR